MRETLHSEYKTMLSARKFLSSRWSESSFYVTNLFLLLQAHKGALSVEYLHWNKHKFAKWYTIQTLLSFYFQSRDVFIILDERQILYGINFKTTLRYITLSWRNIHLTNEWNKKSNRNRRIEKKYADFMRIIYNCANLCLRSGMRQ